MKRFRYQDDPNVSDELRDELDELVAQNRYRVLTDADMSAWTEPERQIYRDTVESIRGVRTAALGPKHPFNGGMRRDVEAAARDQMIRDIDARSKGGK